MQINLIKKSDSPQGVDALFTLSYSAAAAADKPQDWRRRLLFSLYSIRCLFDNNDLLDPPALLTEFGCCFVLPPAAHPDFSPLFDGNSTDSITDSNTDKNGEICGFNSANPTHTDPAQTDFNAESNQHGKTQNNQTSARLDRAFFDAALKQTDTVLLGEGAILTDICGQKKLKFDVGSPLFYQLSNTHYIPKNHQSYPKKFGICQAVSELITLPTCNNELKSLWFLLFPSLLHGAPDLKKHLGKIKSVLDNSDVYHALAVGEFAASLQDELPQFSVPALSDWFEGFNLWRKTAAPRTDSNSDKIYSKPPIHAENSETDDDFADGLVDINEDTYDGGGDGLADAAIAKSTTDGSTDDGSTEDGSTEFGSAEFEKELLAIVREAEQIFAASPNDEDSLVALLAARSNLPKKYQTAELLMNNLKLSLKFLPTSTARHLLTFYVGLSFLGLGQLEKARRSFEICLTLKSDYPPAKEMLQKLNELK